MYKNLKVSKSIEIDTDLASMWEVLTHPEKIKVYLYGTETITDWEVGSPIIFQGEYEGQKYKDKGNVLENTPYKCLKYNYWSGFSGLEDQLENYSIITYQLELLSERQVKFTWIQAGFSSEEGRQHTENGLSGMLERIKELAEM